MTKTDNLAPLSVGGDLVSVQGLTVEYISGKSAFAAVREANLTIRAGETVALVGESGCGKTTLALSLIGLLPSKQSRITAGSLSFDGQDMRAASNDDWRILRGRRIAMVFQDPFAALNPVLTIGHQLGETIELDSPKDGEPPKARAAELLKMVQLDESERILRSYPHQMSGGQRQRVMIAMALARRPDLLIADEPTTALDVTIQDEIVKLLRRLQEELRMAMLFVTHNVGLVQQIAARTAVMYAGRIVEHGSSASVLSDPQHPYTQGLLKSLPTLTSRGTLPILEGQPPEPAHVPPGCAFHPRCPRRFEPCDKVDPAERPSGSSLTRCHLYPEQ